MKKRFLFYFWLALSFIEAIILNIAKFINSKEAGRAAENLYSLNMLIVLFFFLLTSFFLFVILRSEAKVHKLLELNFNSVKSNKFITSLGVVSFYLLYLTLFTPTVYFKEFEAVFIELKPILIWLELFLIQTVIWIKVSKKTFRSFVTKQPSDIKCLFYVFVPLLLIWLIISITKVGLIKDTAFWNVPGIPLSMIQFLGLTLFLALGLIISSQNGDHPDKLKRTLRILIPIGIYLAAVLMWGFTPMLKHFFSLQPTLPNLQPFPYSDARVHDLGALSISWGKGVYFYGYTDKPMYMLYLAILHFFTNNDYNLLQWAQILVLATAPVILYKLGKKAFGTLFGITAAMMLVFQQSNAITLSYKVASVNPKLLVTEELMLLGVILVTYILFEWMQSAETNKVFLLGGLLGAFSLVRMNPIFILPAIALVILIRFRKAPKQIIKQLVILTIGFSLVFSPWLFTGVDPEGRSWFFLKIQDVINTRYKNQTEIIPMDQPSVQYISISPQVNSAMHGTNFSGIFMQSTELGSPASLQENAEPVSWVMLNHFLHNFSTSLLALPDSIKVYNVSDVSAREYWQDVNQWDGNFPPVQYLRILLNLFILSIGIAFAWRVHRWPGLTPLLVFAAYNLSLSAALNSGSRYIVPINWIFFFYYALGLITIGRFILSLLGLRPVPGWPQFPATKTEMKKSLLQSWLPSVAAMFILALSLPTANLVLPKLIHSDVSATQLFDYVKARESKGSELIAGRLLYPYYQEKDLITFDFLAGSEISSFSISQNYLTVPKSIVLESGDPALLSVIYNNDKAELLSIYVLDKNTPKLFWQID